MEVLGLPSRPAAAEYRELGANGDNCRRAQPQFGGSHLPARLAVLAHMQCEAVDLDPSQLRSWLVRAGDEREVATLLSAAESVEFKGIRSALLFVVTAREYAIPNRRAALALLLAKVPRVREETVLLARSVENGPVMATFSTPLASLPEATDERVNELLVSKLNVGEATCSRRCRGRGRGAKGRSGEGSRRRAAQGLER